MQVQQYFQAESMSEIKKSKTTNTKWIQKSVEPLAGRSNIQMPNSMHPVRQTTNEQ